MASNKKIDLDEVTKCSECKKVVANVEKGVQCELCDLWFHSKCEGVSDETYKIMNQDKVHFYCGRCDKTVGQLLKKVMELKARQDMMEEKMKSFQEEVKNDVKDFVSTIMEEVKTKNEKIEKLDKSVEEMLGDFAKFKREQKSDFKKLSGETFSLNESEKMAKKVDDLAKALDAQKSEIKELRKTQIDLMDDNQVKELSKAFIKDGL